MHHCATPGSVTRHARSPSSRRSMGWLASVVKWGVPITTLALFPKCPACVAGYILLFTGVGLSLQAAATIRWVLVGLSVLLLIVLALRKFRGRRKVAKERVSPAP